MDNLSLYERQIEYFKLLENKGLIVYIWDGTGHTKFFTENIRHFTESRKLKNFKNVSDRLRINGKEIIIESDDEEWDINYKEGNKIKSYLDENNIPYELIITGGKGLRFHIYLFSEYSQKRIFAFYIYLCKQIGIEYEQHGLPENKQQNHLLGTIGKKGKLGYYCTFLKEIPSERPKTFYGQIQFPDEINLWKIPEEFISNSLREEKKEKEEIVKNKFEELKYGFRKQYNPIDIFTSKQRQAEIFNEIQPIFYDRNQLWWLWDSEDKYWKVVDEVDILNMIYKTTGKDIISSKSRNEILNSLKQIGRDNIPQESSKNWVQFKNGIIDLENDGINLIEPSANYFITNPIPWEIGESEETPIMDKLFEEWVGIEYRETLYEIIAFGLSPTYFIHRINCLIGSGSNGKSSFLRLMKKFIGGKNVTSTELDLLTTNRFESAKLYKKSVCIMGETNFNTLKQTSLIKRLTGQDFIGFEFKNKMPFDGENYAKILIATNTLPVTYDKTEGFYRRWSIIKFPNKFTEGQDILGVIPDEEYKNLARKCIKILKFLRKEGKFTNEGTIEFRERKYEEESDPLGKFVQEECIIDVNVEIPFFIFYERFLIYLENRGLRKQNKKEISLQLDEKGYQTEKKNVKFKDGEWTKWIYIIGLKLKDYHETKFGGQSYV